MVFSIKLLQAFTKHILMDGMSTFWLDGHRNVFGRLLHKSFRNLSHTPVLWWEIGRESDSRKIYGGKVNLYVPYFQNSIDLSQWKISPSQSSLVIPTYILGILTSTAISPIIKLILLKKTYVFTYLNALVSLSCRFKALVSILL